MIEGQQKTFKEQVHNGSGLNKYMIDMGSQILRVVVDFDKLVILGHDYLSALKELRKQKNLYNPHVLNALESFDFDSINKESLVKTVYVKNIIAGVIAYENIKSKNGILLVPKGQEITYAVIAKLQNFAQGVGVHEPFRVQVIT